MPFWPMAQEQDSPTQCSKRELGLTLGMGYAWEQAGIQGRMLWVLSWAPGPN